MNDDIPPPPSLSLVPPAQESPDESIPQDVWLVPDVCAYLKRKKSWVHREAAAGRLPCTRALGRLAFDAEAVRAWWKSQQKGGR